MRSLAASLVLMLSLPACSIGTGNCGERFITDVGLLTAERWVMVQPSSGVPQDASDTTEVLRLDVTSVEPGARSVGTPRQEEIAIHGSFIPQVHDPLAGGDEVFLALVSADLEREMVSYVVFRHPDGSHDFAQACWMQDLHDRIRSDFRDDADRMLDQLIGTTGAKRTAHLVFPPA